MFKISLTLWTTATLWILFKPLSITFSISACCPRIIFTSLKRFSSHCLHQLKSSFWASFCAGNLDKPRETQSESQTLSRSRSSVGEK